jgi:hypothetical protein
MEETPVEKLLPELDQILESIKNRPLESTLELEKTEPVPDHIAKTCLGIKSFGVQWADAIEDAAKKQLEEDTKRFDRSVALAKQIREDAEAESNHVEEWAMRTRSAGIGLKEVIELLNGHDATKKTISS